jgi:hypothetical protein
MTARLSLLDGRPLFQLAFDWCPRVLGHCFVVNNTFLLSMFVNDVLEMVFYDPQTRLACGVLFIVSADEI